MTTQKSSESQVDLPEATLGAILDMWATSNQEHRVLASGTSMLPLIRAGDTLGVVHGSRVWRPGDIVVFRRPDGLIAHRVLQVKQSGDQVIVLAKGDNAPDIDPPVMDSQVIGRVNCIYKPDGRSIDITTTRWRWAGWAVGYLSWGSAVIYAVGRKIRRKLWWSKENNTTNKTRQIFHRFLHDARRFFLSWVTREKL